MKRKIIRIDEEKCDGCGLCVPSCAEGALQIVDGKARLVKDSFCDGLGNCLGDCPQNAITIEEREADPFDEAAAMAHVEAQKQRDHQTGEEHHKGGCPGMRSMSFKSAGSEKNNIPYSSSQPSMIEQWPVQLHLVSPAAPRCWSAVGALPVTIGTRLLPCRR